MGVGWTTGSMFVCLYMQFMENLTQFVQVGLFKSHLIFLIRQDSQAVRVLLRTELEDAPLFGEFDLRRFLERDCGSRDESRAGLICCCWCCCCCAGDRLVSTEEGTGRMGISPKISHLSVVVVVVVVVVIFVFVTGNCGRPLTGKPKLGVLTSSTSPDSGFGTALPLSSLPVSALKLWW
ncbi:hypothetical protein WICPIJ_005081 [Wickerhamomyces pijperi]|uniref:Transmembrane protein n=1 Tax=Wickerhamomyces pijperi TaxID=599730 RepID=A0A9P8Q4J5_WICPI|nr:hypothetical protein WICPIJ_005081 [Wickerhamomyces pijperi]